MEDKRLRDNNKEDLAKIVIENATKTLLNDEEDTIECVSEKRKSALRQLHNLANEGLLYSQKKELLHTLVKVINLPQKQNEDNWHGYRDDYRDFIQAVNSFMLDIVTQD